MGFGRTSNRGECGKAAAQLLGCHRTGGSPHGFVVEAVACEPHSKTNQCAGHDRQQDLMCLICGWIYDESVGAPDEGILLETRWPDVPMNWVCPECGRAKKILKWFSF